MVELVDTPGLEPGAARRAGSSPVLGKLYYKYLTYIDKSQKKVQKKCKNLLKNNNKSIYLSLPNNPG